MSSTSGHVQLLKLLPSKDQDEFLRFIYPLRVRAAVFFAVIQLIYYVVDFVIIQTARRDIGSSPYYLAKRVTVFVLESLLIAVVCVGSIRVVSLAVHVWFFLTALSRLGILAFAVTELPVSGTYLMSMLCTVSIGITGIATTMHISFILVLAMCVPLLVLFSVAVHQTEGFDDDFPKQSASVYVLVIFATVLFVIHTVQYNTVMMFLWNQRYKTEKVEKDAQNRMELLHRMHLANTLHDIGSPLQAFTTGLEELKVWIAGLPKQCIHPIVHDALSGMEAAITLMSLARRRAIAYAKSFAHTDTDVLQPQYTRVDIAQLAAESMKVVQALSRNRQCDVEIKFLLGADIPPVIWTDGEWIVEVLTNLLSNAVKFTDEGYIELRVFPTTKGGSTRSNNASPRLRSPFHQPLADGGLYDGTHSPVLRFEVRDTGRGISPEATESLFQPFWQERGADRKLGSGLGLSSVKMKIEQLDGRVGAYPHHPIGSVFWFEIPIILEPHRLDEIATASDSKWGDVVASEPPVDAEKPKLSPSPSPSPSPKAQGQPQPHRAAASDDQSDQKFEPLSVEELLVYYNIDAAKISVLLVEDEHMLRKFTKKLLERVGFRVDEACDGADGLRRMQQKAYDVVLMDQNMPQTSGLEAVRLFREWQAQAGTPLPSESDPLIFVVSASILENDRTEAIDLRIAEFLEKPLHVNRIAAQVLARIAAHPELLTKFQRSHHCSTCICQQLEAVDEEQQEQQLEQLVRSATEAVSAPEEGVR